MKQQRDMSGVLFRNEKKTQDNHPDYTGNATINGEDMWLSAWIKSGQKGKFMSLAFKPKEAEKPEPKKPRADPGSRSIGDMEDDIPF